MIFVHTDYYKYFLHNYNKHKILNKNIINNKMLKEIKDISNKVIIPTYNYDFGKNGFFKLLEDKSQVGSFSDYIRKKFKKNRSTVPMFSSCSLFKRKAINLSEVIDPFGKDSDFDLLIQKRGKIIFFGSEFAPTFIIFIEKNIPGGVPYRFNKIFKGSIYFKSEKKNAN